MLREDPCSEDPTLKAVVFERTPVMSTFLLAFIVGGVQKYIVVYTRHAQFASSSASNLSASGLTGCLLLIVVGEFETAEQRDEDGVVHRLYAPVGKLEHGRRVLDVSLALRYWTTLCDKITCSGSCRWKCYPSLIVTTASNIRSQSSTTLTCPNSAQVQLLIGYVFPRHILSLRVLFQ